MNTPAKKLDLLEAAPETYPAFLAELKHRIRSARLKASLSVNRELVASVLEHWARHSRAPKQRGMGSEGGSIGSPRICGARFLK